MKGGGRYGSLIDAFKELKAMGLAVVLPAHGRTTKHGQQVGQWKWALTEAGKRLQQEIIHGGR